MKFAYSYDHHHGAGAEWERRDLKDWITGVFEIPRFNITQGCTPHIRKHVETELLAEGWALKVRIAHGHQLTIFAAKDDLGFHLQTGNVSRAPYDLLKMEYLFQRERINAAALALPTTRAAKALGQNIVNAERLIHELKLFDRVITVPILVLAFE